MARPKNPLTPVLKRLRKLQAKSIKLNAEMASLVSELQSSTSPADAKPAAKTTAKAKAKSGKTAKTAKAPKSAKPAAAKKRAPAAKKAVTAKKAAPAKK